MKQFLSEHKLATFMTVFVIGFITLIMLSPFTVINPGSRGLVITFGEVNPLVLDEGFHVIAPWSNVIEMDVRKQKIETTLNAASKDLQTVNITIALNYQLEASKINSLYREIGRDFESRIIAPAIQEAVKAGTAKYTAEELITRREEVSQQIFAKLAERLSKSYIIVSDLSIVNFAFSESFATAIEEKQTAQQDALKAENDLVRIKTEAEQRVAQAEADAEAIRIQAQAITQQGGKDYVQLQAIEKWDGKLPNQFVPGQTVPFLNLSQ